MGVMNIQCKCGSMDFFTEEKGNSTGLYCSMCGKWQKWLNKDELRAFNNAHIPKKKNISSELGNTKIQKLKEDIKALDKHHDGIVNVYEVLALIDDVFNNLN